MYFNSGLASVSKQKLDRCSTPEDPLDVLDLDPEFTALLSEAKIFTIRQFASVDLGNFVVDAKVLRVSDALLRKHKVAIDFVNGFTYAAPIPVQVHAGDILYGYIYVSEKEKRQIVSTQLLKSPYVLFEEYMKCTPENRIDHPWLNIFYRHAKETAEQLGIEEYKVTDLDVYGYLTWRASTNWGKLDYTAGPRAIYFHWFYLLPKVHAECMEVDRVLTETHQNPYFAKRHEVLLRINLTRMLNEDLGKMYCWEPDTPNLWFATDLKEGMKRSKKGGLAHYNFRPGSSLFEGLPYGCIVTPTGTIDANLIDEVTIVPKEVPGMKVQYYNI